MSHSFRQDDHTNCLPGEDTATSLKLRGGKVKPPADNVPGEDFDNLRSLDAPGQGTITTVPLVFSDSRLELNAVGQCVRVALLDDTGSALKGFGWEDCDAVTGDHTAKTVTWRGKSDLRQVAGKPVRLHVELTRGKLYAFQFAK